MSTLPRVGDLELDQDLEFQRHSWRVQRIGWIIKAVILDQICGSSAWRSYHHRAKTKPVWPAIITKSGSTVSGGKSNHEFHESHEFPFAFVKIRVIRGKIPFKAVEPKK